MPLKTWIAYGKTGLNIELSDKYNVQIVQPSFTKAMANPASALKDSLNTPISAPALLDFVDEKDKVAIIISDITRPVPNEIILPAVLNELKHVNQQNITLFVALGTHRPNSEEELRTLIGDEIYDNYKIVQNNAFKRSTQTKIGYVHDREIWLNKELLNCDKKILTGFIEPHFFAGFSGGGKAIMPGMAGQETVLSNHNAEKMVNPKAVWGITEGNPIWEEIHQVVDLVHGTFLVNVTLNKNKEITAVFSGDLRAAHKEGCDFVRQSAMIEVNESYDIVITSNSGYPLDLNLYQSIKGVSAARQIVKKGGSIIVATECWDGIPDHGLYGKMLQSAPNPKELLENILNSKETKQDQWQVQVQTQVQLFADVYVYTNNLSAGQIKNALLLPCRSIEETVAELMQKYGDNARICVLPEGPQTVPYLATKNVVEDFR
jgi:nickel-dependent lactate racemase